MSAGGYRLQEPDFLEEGESGCDGMHTEGAFLCAVKMAADEERRGGGRRTGNEARRAVFEMARLVLEEVGADNLKEMALNQAIGAEDAQGRLIGVLAYAMLSGERFRRETINALGLSDGADRRDTVKRHEETFINGYARVFFDILNGVDVTVKSPSDYGVSDTTLEALLDIWGKGDAADFSGADPRIDRDILRERFINYGYSRKNKGGLFGVELLKQQYKEYRKYGQIANSTWAAGFEALIAISRHMAFGGFALKEMLDSLLEKCSGRSEE